jgi:hypothetical protein
VKKEKESEHVLKQYVHKPYKQPKRLSKRFWKRNPRANLNYKQRANKAQP